MDDFYEIKLTDLVYGGEALGRLPDNRAVFVPYALPGEIARVQLSEQRRHYVRANLVEVLEPSPERIIPRCQHFGVCGGCQWQHLPYKDQLEYKTSILRDQLQRIGGIIDAPVEQIRSSTREWYYRNAVQCHLTAEGKLGFQQAGSHRVIEIKECYLPENPLLDFWHCLDLEDIPNLTRIELRLGASGEVFMAFESSDPEPPDFTVDMPVSAVHLGPGGAIVLSGDDYVLMDVSGRIFRVSAGAFFQVNTVQTAEMVEHVLSNLALSSQVTVLDVYCGVGLFSAFLAPHVGHCVGVEISPAAAGDYAINLDEFDNVSLYEGAAEVVLPVLELDPDIVLVDPPRSGMERSALDAIINKKPPVIVYVSCDPATLARDMQHLSRAGYQLDKVTPFDMFPQTYHIESVSIFRSS